MKILLVDTDTTVLERLEESLQKEGHEVSACSMGSIALTKAIMHDFDMLICELTLPDLPGTEIIRAMKAQAPYLPVIVISALPVEEWGQPSADAGAARFLKKSQPWESLWNELQDELHFITMGRAEMKVAIIDPNMIHRTRLQKTFEHLGCEVSVWPDVLSALSGMAHQDKPSLLLLDTSIELSMEALQWAREKRVLTFVFSDTLTDDEHDNLMRAGAALILTKPINGEALMTQARFMAHS
ncbi:MAG: hypothetical protein CL920_16805 [Deltaproteobacteria bacterium]|nr:hypothetical protein [Deltaproteobacteria bacterium]MBU50341.1 hypothetical protein [Deltaproteobacteria bacterium]